MSILIGTQETFENDILKHSGIVFVDFYADWCGPCKMTAPIIEELSQDPAYKDIRFVKINVDENQDLAGQFNVFSIPTFIVFINGEVVIQFAGARDKTGFKSTLDAALEHQRNTPQGVVH